MPAALHRRQRLCNTCVLQKVGSYGHTPIGALTVGALAKCVCMHRAGIMLQTVNKHYICERPATNPLPVAPTPDNAAPIDCSTMPAMPQGAVAPVALINAGGPAMCNYFAADNDGSQGGGDGVRAKTPATRHALDALQLVFGSASKRVWLDQRMDGSTFTWATTTCTLPAGCGHTLNTCAVLLLLPPAVAAGGGADNWVSRNPACQTQRAACSVRFGGAFSYSIRTAAGRSYRLRFTFSEVWWNAAGLRLFDVLVDGATVLAGVDPYDLAGGKFSPVVREVTRTAGRANMVVSLQSRVDNAALASLEVSLTAVRCGSDTVHWPQTCADCLACQGALWQLRMLSVGVLLQCRCLTWAVRQWHPHRHPALHLR